MPLSKIIDSYTQKTHIHSEGTAAEYFLNIVRRGNGVISWNKETITPYSFVHGLVDAQAAMNAIRREKCHLDLHAWVFIPNSFRLLLHDLFILGYTQLIVHELVDTIGHEFYVFLRKSEQIAPLNRLEVLQQIESDLYTENR